SCQKRWTRCQTPRSKIQNPPAISSTPCPRQPASFVFRSTPTLKLRYCYSCGGFSRPIGSTLLLFRPVDHDAGPAAEPPHGGHETVHVVRRQQNGIRPRLQDDQRRSHGCDIRLNPSEAGLPERADVETGGGRAHPDADKSAQRPAQYANGLDLVPRI